MRERERGAHRAWGKVPWLWYMKKRETNLEQRLQEGEQSSCKTAEFRARVEVGMVMVVLVFANPEKNLSRSSGSGVTRGFMASEAFARR